MASLVLSGDTSGSITVAAPAVSGSNTQTLAAVTGTLAPLVSGTTITLTNQTAPDFTGIPSWVKRITLMFNGVSANSTGIPLIQLGDSGGYETTGYSAMSTTVTTTNNTTRGVTSTSGFLISYAGGATEIYSGSFTFSLLGSNTWACVGMNFNPTSNSVNNTSGVKTLSDTLTSLRLFIDGTQFFDAGTINILFE
jgi:hypothetical protein